VVEECFKEEAVCSKQFVVQEGERHQEEEALLHLEALECFSLISQEAFLEEEEFCPCFQEEAGEEY